ncbi:MAG: hypothetical protein ABIG37_02625 [Nanoarchaeota archaeon]|nr:hypothetical protein [Nanoarchaeota archaeon]
MNLKKIFKPEFFGIFGFILIVLISILIISSAEKLSNWTGYILLIIGIIGLIVDGTIVFNVYLKNKLK